MTRKVLRWNQIWSAIWSYFLQTGWREEPIHVHCPTLLDDNVGVWLLHKFLANTLWIQLWIYIWFYWQRDIKMAKGKSIIHRKKSLSNDMELYVGPINHVEWMMMQLFYPRQLENGEWLISWFWFSSSIESPFNLLKTMHAMQYSST